MQSEGLRTEAWEAPARGAAHGTAASQHSCQAVTQRGRSRDGDGDGARGTPCDATRVASTARYFRYIDVEIYR